MKSSQRGNVFVYILIAVLLFGGLMFAIAQSNNSEDPTGDFTDGQTKILANEMIAYAASVSSAMAQMEQGGTEISSIDFILPSDSNFNTAPTKDKLFHPDGGGLNYKALRSTAAHDDGTTPAAGYYVGRFNHVGWTPTTAQDVVFTAFKVTQSVCAALNLKIRNDATIPTASGTALRNLFVDDALHSGSNTNFTTANCASCDEIPALCVTDGAGLYAFYSILDAQ